MRHAKPMVTAINQPLKLKTARREDIFRLYCVLLLLVMTAVLLGPHPVIVGLFIGSVVGVGGYLFRRFCLWPSEANLSVVIFPDGEINMSDKDGHTIKASLGDHHWVTPQIAVLAVVSNERSHRLIFLAKQQSIPDYRRLTVWLKQKIA